MGLFGKKESCSICGSNKNVHRLSDGFACATCLYNAGEYSLQVQTTVREVKDKLSQSQSDETSSKGAAGNASNPFNSIEYTKGLHMAGLPLSVGVMCNIYLHEDKIVFSDGNNMFNLAMHKITNAIIKTDTEIQQLYVSSVGGAVGGAVLFGPLGAMVGGRAKKKTVKTKSHYLIFTYIKDGAIDYISFDVTGNILTARTIESYIQGRVTSSASVDL